MHIIKDIGFGGAEKLVSDLLPVLKRKGVDVSIVCLNDKMSYASGLIDADINITVLEHGKRGFNLFNLLRSRRKLRAVIMQQQPDIIHSHLYLADLLVWISAPVGSRIVVTIHNTYKWWRWWEAKGKRMRYFAMTKVSAILGRLRNSTFICVSKTIEKNAIDFLEINKGKISKVYNGIVLDNFNVKTEYNQTESPVIIQVGNLRRQKDHITSLKAFRVLLQKHKRAKLLFVGDGHLRQEIEENIASMGLEGSVSLLGQRSDVPELLRNSDVFWMPSLFEGLSIASLEAMACGLPMVVTDTAGLTESVIDGKTGFFIKIGDFNQLAKWTSDILKDVSLARSMGCEGRKRVEELFSIGVTASGYIKVYKDMMQIR